MRGDGPRIVSSNFPLIQFSPRAWGWSVTRTSSLDLRIVLPTCVGMVRRSASCLPRSTGSPHVRGDGPQFSWPMTVSREFSPRAWGWSAVKGSARLLDEVLPTCVGMVQRSPPP